MKRPAVFFDRDNTLIIGSEYLGDPEQVRLTKDAAELVAAVRTAGYATVVASNQSGVARGYFTEQDVRAVNRRMDEHLKADNPLAIIDRHEYCPYHPEGEIEQYRRESDLRKPAPGMLLLAADRLGLDLKRSWMVGDAARDIEAGHAAGCRTILVIDPSLNVSPAALLEPKVEPDFVVSNLREAMSTILTAGEPAAEAPAPPEPAKPIERAAVTPAPSADSNPREATSPARPTSAPASASSRPEPDAQTKLLRVAEQLLGEVRRRNEPPISDFSVSKLIAGIAQVLALAVLFVAYLNRGSPGALTGLLLLAIYLQVLTATLLLMDRRS
jgi:histidinol-phosphate phosphatase family protein